MCSYPDKMKSCWKGEEEDGTKISYGSWSMGIKNSLHLRLFSYLTIGSFDKEGFLCRPKRYDNDGTLVMDNVTDEFL